MTIYPCVNAYNGPTEVPGTSNAAPLSPAELATQDACDLGYLAMLIKEDPTGQDPNIEREIQRIYQKLKGDLDAGKITDPTINQLITSMIGNVGAGGFSSAAQATFLNTWQTGAAAQTIQGWMQGNDTDGVPPFSFQNNASAPSPDTVFAYLMFENSLAGIPGEDPNGATYSGLNSFYAQQGGVVSFAQQASIFLCAYLGSGALDISGDELASILPVPLAPPGGGQPTGGYVSFIEAFEGTSASSYQNWTLPPGLTYAEAVAGVESFVINFLP